MQPAARLGDNHVCPMVDPVGKPHVGGPVVAGLPTVLVGSMPSARIGDAACCCGPPDALVLGAPTVLVGGAPTSRVGDSSAHGGVVVCGLPTVLVGGAGGGGAAGGGGGGGGAVVGAMAAVVRGLGARVSPAVCGVAAAEAKGRPVEPIVKWLLGHALSLAWKALRKKPTFPGLVAEAVRSGDNIFRATGTAFLRTFGTTVPKGPNLVRMGRAGVGAASHGHAAMPAMAKAWSRAFGKGGAKAALLSAGKEVGKEFVSGAVIGAIVSGAFGGWESWKAAKASPVPLRPAEVTGRVTYGAVRGAAAAVAGEATGAVVGAAIGAAIGSIIPIGGTLAGAVIGAKIGMFIGPVVGPIMGRAVGAIAGERAGEKVERALDVVGHVERVVERGFDHVAGGGDQRAAEAAWGRWFAQRSDEARDAAAWAADARLSAAAKAYDQLSRPFRGNNRGPPG